MKSKIAKIFLNDSGYFLGRGKGCLIVKHRKGKVEEYPLFENEVGEVQIKIGNSVSSGALATCAFWGIDLLILTQRGNPVAYLKSLEDDSHVKTRLCQYEAMKNGKAAEIAKKIVLSRIEGQSQILKKYGMRQHDVMRAKETINNIESNKLSTVIKKLLSIEGKHTEHYFHQIFKLMPKSILKTERRKNFKAYDGVNNTFNLAYTVLKWKVHRAVIRAKLEPFLGFLHSEQFGKPSLVCDLMELYRYLVDDFIIQYAKNLRKKDFSMNQEDFSSNRKGKREYLTKQLSKDLMIKLNSFFESKVEVPRVKHGNRQEIESLLNEEALLLAKYLRGEKADWVPRIPALGSFRLNHPLGASI
ncbi:MAG: CRISPR-associated endonuclease Cas1 [Candidatus Bathyarchaeota archaeon]|nr:CRISPR-associated endonuclease Cas1 [Candidatus Bathyarchaeota archaeon]